MSEQRLPMLLSGPLELNKHPRPASGAIMSQAGPAIHGTWAGTYAPRELLKRRCKDLCACSEDKQHFWRCQQTSEAIQWMQGLFETDSPVQETNLDLQQNRNLWSDVRRGPHMRGQSQREGSGGAKWLLAPPNCPSDSCSHQLDPIENWQSGVSHMLSRACMHTTSILYSQIAQKPLLGSSLVCPELACWQCLGIASQASIHNVACVALICRSEAPRLQSVSFRFCRSDVVPPRYSARSCFSAHARCTDA